MILKEFKADTIYQGRLDKDVEIIGGLSTVMKQYDITAGMVSGIGAVSKAELGYYDGETKSYEKHLFQENMEIVSFKGNISYKDDEIFPHLHAVLSRRDFSAIGGHLFSGTVYAFEFEIIILEGQPFVRKSDEETGLFLWRGQ